VPWESSSAKYWIPGTTSRLGGGGLLVAQAPDLELALSASPRICADAIVPDRSTSTY